MGQEVVRHTFTGADRQRYREKVHRCLDVLARMLAESRFDFDLGMTGMEVELNLVDGDFQPSMDNARVLEDIADPDFQTELARFNIEVNSHPRRLSGTAALELEMELRRSLDRANQKAKASGSRIVMIGILPTLQEHHLRREFLSANPRYALLDEQIVAARGENLPIEIDGPERLSISTGSIAPEAACTSVQLHLQVTPESFAAHWNAAQAIAGVQVALAANSPYLCGHELWHETRIDLFQQATDTRSVELIAQGVRPRVWFGERWVTSIFDLFEENARYFPALLPICDDEDPGEVLGRGGAPSLAELRLHNGTVYRWNRPVYDVVNDRPHLRVENRVLPAGPTVVDVLANAAFYYGLLRCLTEDDRPIWSQMSFQAAEENLQTGARHGLEARLFWPGTGMTPVSELVLGTLLPLAHEGLRRWDVADEVRERLLGVIEGRCRSMRNGATWQLATVHRLEDEEHLTRRDALVEMTRCYVEHMDSNLPVHLWQPG